MTDHFPDKNDWLTELKETSNILIGWDSHNKYTPSKSHSRNDTKDPETECLGLTPALQRALLSKSLLRSSRSTSLRKGIEFDGMGLNLKRHAQQHKRAICGILRVQLFATPIRYHRRSAGHPDQWKTLQNFCKQQKRVSLYIMLPDLIDANAAHNSASLTN